MEWSFITGRGCWEISARVNPPLAVHEKVWPPLSHTAKCTAPLHHVTYTMWLLPWICSLQLVTSLGENYKGKYDVGGSGGTPPEKILHIGIKKVPFEQEKTATPLLEYEKKTSTPLFSWKKSSTPHLNIPTTPPGNKRPLPDWTYKLLCLLSYKVKQLVSPADTRNLSR